jgi:hypothetical protein
VVAAALLLALGLPGSAGAQPPRPRPRPAPTPPRQPPRQPAPAEPAPVAPVAPQPAVSVGRVRDIERLGRLQDCRGSEGSGAGPGPVRVRRGRGAPASVARGDPVQLDDGLDVDASTDVRLRVESPALGYGTFYLAPRLFCNVRIPNDAAVPPRLTAATSDAAYAFGVDPARPRDDRPLEFAIERGAAIIDWNGGPGRPLVVRAAGRRISVPGTRLAVVVDSTGTEALIYVLSGVVVVDAAANARALEGDLYHVARGTRPPQYLGRVTGRGEPLVRSVRHHSGTVWRAWWQKPAFYVPTALAVGGAVALGVLRPDDDPAQRTGTVLITLPF